MATPALAAAHLQGHLLNHKVTEKPKVEAVKRPTVSTAGTTQDWLYLLSRWEDYVRATKVKGEDQAIQLLECCDPDLRKGIQRNNGGVALSGKPLTDIMKAIKTLAVRVENPTVARDKLHNMTQDREESVRAFGARLRGQAATCQYTKACTCSLIVDYTEENVADALITGLADPEIKQGLLGEPDQPLSMERAMLYVESKEAAKTSVSLLDPGTSMGAVHRSSHKKTALAGRTRPNIDTEDEKCFFCGKTGHGKYPPFPLRSTECHAYGRKCGKKNHADRVCRSKQPSTENALFGTCCDITTRGTGRCRTLDHHVFSNDRWVKRQSLPQPTRHLLVKLIPDDYNQLKIARRPRAAQCNIDGMPDTGCQCCLAGTHILRQLGLSRTDLIPVSQRMQAANKSRIHLLGAIIVEISLPDTKAKSKQMVYVTPSVTRLFLSRETCSDLGLISPRFPSTTTAEASSIPTPGQSRSGSPHNTPSPPLGNGKARGPSREQRPLQSNTSPSAEKRTCGCPTRSLPPTGPIPLPVPATEENRGALEQHLRSIFKASTFNVCTHQPLPMMAGPPLRLNIDPGAKPVTVHKAASVPVHWENKVKEHLDRDVRLGVQRFCGWLSTFQLRLFSSAHAHHR